MNDLSLYEDMWVDAQTGEIKNHRQEFTENTPVRNIKKYYS